MTYHFNRILLLAFAGLGISAAQSLNWEGQTGVFVTPLAYTAASKPVVAYHYLDAGGVLGGFHTASVTEGLFGRVEFGYTRTFHQPGSTTGLSPLWDGGFNIVHGKVNVVRENAGKNKWLPAISAGFVARTQDRHVSGVLGNRITITPISTWWPPKRSPRSSRCRWSSTSAIRRPTLRYSAWPVTLPRTKAGCSARRRW